MRASRACTRIMAAGTTALAVGGLTGAPALAADAHPPGRGRPVPAGFRAQSTTWPLPRYGWVLGSAPCPTGQCTTVVTTRDGGGTWSAVGAPAAPLAPPGEAGVTEIRFADPRHGWAFGPSFFRTSDGGRDWREAPLPGNGRRVLSLAAGAGTVYVAVSPCAPGEEPSACRKPPSVWRAGVRHGKWRRVPVKLPVGAADGVVIALHHRTAYIAVPGPAGQPDTFFASVTGRRWSPRPSPCDKRQAEALVDVAPMPRGRVALLCVGDAGFSKATKHVFRSADTARTTSDAGTTPRFGIQSGLAATPAGTLVVSSVSSGSWLYRNTRGRNWGTVLDMADGGSGWNDLLFTTGRDGFVVYGPAAGSDRAGVLLATHDAGGHWAPVKIGPSAAGGGR
ncbi:WD40/YVTN/BNR-like repeat-containing protein [Actinomadura formosensis]|uniref:WD40/YVTN/BNR-like repeat-containing protein n=1 Tax=Actinomadura formosensis TaxID=60706 RepID=UPI003D8C43B3